MRTGILIVVVMLCLGIPAIAQQDSIAKKKMHRTWISLLGKSEVKEGILFEIKESSVVLSSSADKKDYYKGTFTVSNIDVKSINTITLFKGIKKITIPIYGHPQNFNKYKKELTACAFKNNSVVIRSYYFSRLKDIVTDADGNVYHTIALGGQVWMAENLKVTHFGNGEAIPEVNENTDWEHATTGSSCRDVNKSSEDSTSGRLYNWNAVADIRGLCPKGWHVPTVSEWSWMIICFGGEFQAGKRLTEAIPASPGDPAQKCLNEIPFALPGSFRYGNGEYSSGKILSYQWWSATPQDSTLAKALQLGNDKSWVYFIGSDKRSGLPVRCLRDQ